MEENYRKAYEDYIEPVPEGFEVHHLDHDRTNNFLYNLIALPKELHRKYHKYYTRLMKNNFFTSLTPIKIITKTTNPWEFYREKDFNNFQKYYNEILENYVPKRNKIIEEENKIEIIFLKGEEKLSAEELLSAVKIFKERKEKDLAGHYESLLFLYYDINLTEDGEWKSTFSKQTMQ